MITILQGKREELNLYVSKKYTNTYCHVLYGNRDFAAPFLIFRSLIPFLRNHIADQTIDNLLFSHKTYISIIYEYLSPYLNHDEMKRKHLGAARLDSNSTHSTVAKADITRSCAEILLDLHTHFQFSLIIPSVTYLDVNSLDLLKYIYQVHSKDAPDLILGYDADWEEDNYDQATGISVYHRLDTVTFLQSFVYSFKTISTVKKKIRLKESHLDRISTDRFDMDRRIDKYDDDLEWIAHQLLQNNSLPDIQQSEVIVKAVEKCFRLFDFTNAMLLSQQAQKKEGLFLSRESKATLLHIEGLCAHNRHFFTQGNLPLANHLQYVFERALKDETNESHRICLLYRLIVTLSRRKNDLNGAAIYVDQAYRELENFSGSNKEILMAWINNVHSYMLMKEGDLNAAIRKHEEAYQLLDKKIADGLNISADEVDYTKAVLAENLSTLNSLRGDFKQMSEWYTIETSYTDKWPSLSAVSSAEWQSFYYQQLKITEALANAKQGLEKSRESFNYILEYFFTLSLAEIHNRLGEEEQAITYYKKCLVFHKQIGRSYTQITFFALQMALIKLAVLSQRYEDAFLLIEKMETQLIDKSPVECVDILEQAAVCNTCLGQIEQAEEKVNKAIEIAVNNGDCSLLLKVNLVAGRICQLLNRNEDARNAYLQAQDISGTVVDGIAFKATASDAVMLYLGLLETGEMNTSLLKELVKELSIGLAKSIDCWWNVKRVLQLIASLSPSEKLLITESSAYRKILDVAAQRKDCLAFSENYATVYTEI